MQRRFDRLDNFWRDLFWELVPEYVTWEEADRVAAASADRIHGARTGSISKPATSPPVAGPTGPSSVPKPLVVHHPPASRQPTGSRHGLLDPGTCTALLLSAGIAALLLFSSCARPAAGFAAKPRLPALSQGWGSADHSTPTTTRKETTPWL